MLKSLFARRARGTQVRPTDCPPSGRRSPRRASLLDLPGRTRLSAPGGRDLAVSSGGFARSLAASPPPATPHSIPRSCAFMRLSAPWSLQRASNDEHLPRRAFSFQNPSLFNTLSSDRKGCGSPGDSRQGGLQQEGLRAVARCHQGQVLREVPQQKQLRQGRCRLQLVSVRMRVDSRLKVDSEALK